MISVACGVLWRQDKVLLTQRPEGKAQAGLWELPGGKLEAQESAEMALQRELWEELGLKVSIGDFLAETVWRVDAASSIRLMAYHCHCDDWSRFTLHEHQDYFWYDPHQPLALPLAPADQPLLDALRQQMAPSHGDPDESTIKARREEDE